jgi:predicted RNA-binding protein with EMAP domain
MDTAEDPRLLVAEKALEDLAQRVNHGHIKTQYDQKAVQEACQTGLNALQALKYSYAEPDDLVEMPQFDELMGVADEVEALLGGEDFHSEIDEEPIAVARARWTVDTIRTLPDRIHLEGQNRETAVDARVGTVLSVREHPNADDLNVTSVAAGRALPVVTNDLDVAADDEVGVALLPPSELRGVISEAMFLGDDSGVLADVSEDGHGRPDVPDEAWHETRNAVSQFLSGS